MTSQDVHNAKKMKILMVAADALSKSVEFVPFFEFKIIQDSNNHLQVIFEKKILPGV